MPALSSRALGRATLARQYLIAPQANAGPASVAALVADLVGMQAQHPQSFYTGLFSRIADFTPDDAAQVGELLTSGELVRRISSSGGSASADRVHSRLAPWSMARRFAISFGVTSPRLDRPRFRTCSASPGWYGLPRSRIR